MDSSEIDLMCGESRDSGHISGYALGREPSPIGYVGFVLCEEELAASSS
jgi:hypothetical protein